ncbi:uncharacterized protein LOC135849437 [Planococcus citri]|uniref:uncharacterized protein LOC135849437 n=1 Tax=Planococcus citri TaxID=170843 RepID=UPI0031F994E2
MIESKKVLLFVFIRVLQFTFNSSQKINTQWPQGRGSIQFSYPTSSPININPFRARPIRTSTPLTFIVNRRQRCIIENTGSTLISTTTQPPLANFTGGILYDETYYFYQDYFYWDLDLKYDAAEKLNGIGSPVQAVSTFYNAKYGTFEKALLKRDGLVQIIIFIYVDFISNSKYGRFESSVRSVREAGTKTRSTEYYSYNWYFTNSLRNDYYAYPGQYTYIKTGKTYYSTTNIVMPRFPLPTISFKQFNDTFGSLRNKNGKRFSHKLSTVPSGPRPIVHGNGIKIVFV